MIDTILRILEDKKGYFLSSLQSQYLLKTIYYPDSSLIKSLFMSQELSERRKKLKGYLAENRDKAL